DRDPQHGTGGSLFRPHRVPLHGTAHRIRSHGPDFREPEGAANGSLHFGKIQLMHATAHSPVRTEGSTLIEVEQLDFCYGSTRTLKDVSMTVCEKEIVAFIGPSGCGKSTLLRCFNRMNDLVPGARVSRGSIRIGGVEIHSPGVDPVEL